MSQPERMQQLLERVHQIGREIVAPAAHDVDARARFPHEAFTALKAEKLLTCYVAPEYGGMGLDFVEVCRICEVLGQYDGSTAMIFSMHQIQVACITHHSMQVPAFQAFVRRMCDEQLLLASATTETGIGGDVRTSSCAVQPDGAFVRLTKSAPCISYCDDADAILVTARRAPDAGPNDQVHVLVRKEDCELEPLETWDTLGFRGTVSVGYVVRARVPKEHVLPAPYADIHAKSMHGFAHGSWSALWLGIAQGAVNKARAFVRAEARKTPGTPPPTAFRLSELDSRLYRMRAGVELGIHAYQARLAQYPGVPFPPDFAWALGQNNLKVTSSDALADIVGGALRICGIAGYRNDTKFSLGRQLRDAHGASLMIHNDRILGQSSMMQIVV